MNWVKWGARSLAYMQDSSICPQVNKSASRRHRWLASSKSFVEWKVSLDRSLCCSRRLPTWHDDPRCKWEDRKSFSVLFRLIVGYGRVQKRRRNKFRIGELWNIRLLCWCRFQCFESWHVVIRERGGPLNDKVNRDNFKFSEHLNFMLLKKSTSAYFVCIALKVELRVQFLTVRVRVRLPCSNSKQQELLSISVSWMKYLIICF